jgi:two-component system, OmpR family, sensor kinase
MASGERRRRAIPLTLRLAWIYAVLVAATLLIVAGVALHLNRRHLDAALDARLVATVDSFRSGPGNRVQTPDDVLAAARAWLSASAFPEDQAVAVRTSDGRVLSAAGGLDVEEIPAWAQLLASTESRWWDVEGDDPVRALTTPLVFDGQPAGTLVVAASREADLATISALLSGIAWASGFGLLFATVLGVAAVRRTLRPLRRMAEEVEQIQRSDDLSRRVRTDAPRDEVGRLADAFDAMLARLEDAFASQRRFLSDASHELRTPLQVARGQLEFLEETVRDAEGRRSVAVATEELERMRRIVEDLLLLARLDEGMPLAREPVEVELVAREALLRGMQLERREHTVAIEEGLSVMADPERLLQVLTNLVTNAVRHGGTAATIAITARREGERVAIAVADTGPGIPSEELQRVFERLYRGESSRTRSPGGAGLGLAIVASLTKAMHGEIAVDSVVGAGTTFTVRLPSADLAETEPIPAR